MTKRSSFVIPPLAEAATPAEVSAAAIKAVAPSTFVALTSAPWARRKATAGWEFADRAATIRGVWPKAERAFTLAPCSTSSFILLKSGAARSRAVEPRALVRSISAPRSSSTCRQAASPYAAARSNGVLPCSSRALTDAP